MSNHRLVYITTPSLEEAQSIGRALVENHFAACVNIIPQMSSIYRWEGKIEQDQETILIAKTQAERIPDLTALVLERHSAETPCLISLPILEGNPDFLKWLTEETS